jgi:SPX domain protein involved in polyphosphate accumulation
MSTTHAVEAAGSARPHAVNRFEVKYFVATRFVPDLAADLAPFTVPDAHGAGGRGYSVFSVYWDTPDLLFFWEKIEGVKYRRKLRFRRYDDSGTVFVEIKQREDRTLHKRRLKWPVDRVRAVFGEGGPGVDWSGLGDDPVMIDRLRLRPVMGVRYRRLAWHGAFDPELRVTIDSRLMYRPAPVDVAAPFDAGSYILDPRVSVLEIKYDHRAPRWLTKVICRHGLKMVRMSKYCSAIDRHFYGGQNT